eukprot:EG_transcript_7559
MPATMLVTDFARRMLILGFHFMLKDGQLPQFWHKTEFRRSALLARLRPEDVVAQNNIAVAEVAHCLWVQHRHPFKVAMDEALHWAERKQWMFMLELSLNSPLGFTRTGLPSDFGVSQFTKDKNLFCGMPFLMPQLCATRDVQSFLLDTTSYPQPKFAAAATLNVAPAISNVHGENDEAVPRRHRHPLGDPSLPVAGCARQVVPFLQKLLSNCEACQPAADLSQCSTSAQLVAALNALGMPFRVEEKVLSKAVEVVQSKKKFGWIYRPRPGKGPLQRWSQKREKHSARRTHRGQEYVLYSVNLLVSSEKVTAYCVDSAQQAIETAPPATAGRLPAGDTKQQCRAYAEAVLPAVRRTLRKPQGWGVRPPRILDDCLTTHEFGRRLVALIGPHPPHLEEEAVTAAILKYVVKEGLVHRAGIDEGGAVIAVQRADVARREDEVSGKSCQLLFVSPCAVAT